MRTLLLTLILLLPSSMAQTAPSAAQQQQQGRQIQQRVLENIDHFMNAPVLATKLTKSAYTLQNNFPNYLQANDRTVALSHFYAQVLSMELKVYYGMETGTMIIFTDELTGASYRDSGNSGFPINDPKMQHYSNQVCVNRDTGITEPCLMTQGSSYIFCENDDCTKVVPCEIDESNGTSESSDGTDDIGTIVDNSIPEVQYYCRQYSIEKVQPGQQLGYIPRSYSCINEIGQFTQEPGTVVYEDETSGEIRSDGTCTFRDGTPVDRSISGPFAYCGNPVDYENGMRSIYNDGTEQFSCDTAFTGVYRSRDYDPRYRSWYVLAKSKLRPFWTEPYAFFTSGQIGITWTEPLFKKNDLGQTQFEGVLAVDYQLDAISNFLSAAYKDSPTFVAIYEAKAPYYMIGSSATNELSKKVLADDPTEPCPTDPTIASNVECEVVRLSVTELAGNQASLVLRNAHLESLKLNFPINAWVAVKEDEGKIGSSAFVAESIIYEHPKANLKWRIMVVTPIERSTEDAVLPGDDLFYPVILVAAMGFSICLAFAILLFKYRSTRAVILADYRFTSAFIIACCLLNLGMFTMLGENTDTMCMLRFWAFLFLASVAVSPLIVKIYRMYRLVGATAAFQKVRITNWQAATYTLPIPMIQGTTLIIFSILDPYSQHEILDLNNGTPVQRIVCDFDTQAFWITECIGAVSLLLVGCSLAYLTRNLDPRFGEAKQLIFSIYNISFTGLVIVLILYLVGVTQQAERALITVSVFWGTSLSSAAFVLPRILQARQALRTSRHGSSSRNQFGGTYVSGIQRPSMGQMPTSYDNFQPRMDHSGSGMKSDSDFKKDYSLDNMQTADGSDDRFTAHQNENKKGDDSDDSSMDGDQKVMSRPSVNSASTHPSSASQHDMPVAEDDRVGNMQRTVRQHDYLPSRSSEPESVTFDGDRCSSHQPYEYDMEGGMR